MAYGASGGTASFVLKMIADRSRFAKEVQLAGMDLTKLAKKADTTGKSSALTSNKLAAGAAVGLTALTGVVAANMKAYQAYGQGVKQVVRMTGASAEDASRITAQWKRFDIAGPKAAMGLRTFAKQLYRANLEGRAGAAAMKYFTDAGVDPAIVKTGTFGQVIEATRQGMSTLTDSTTRTALSVYLFGRSGTSLIPWLTTGAKEMAHLNKVIEEAGLVWNGSQLKGWYALVTAQRETQLMMMGLSVTIGQMFIPIITVLAKNLQWLLIHLRGLSKAIPYLMLAFAGYLVISAAARAVQTLTMAFVGFSKAAKEVGVIKAIWNVLSTGSWTAHAAAVSLDTGAVVANALATDAAVLASKAQEAAFVKAAVAAGLSQEVIDATTASFVAQRGALLGTAAAAAVNADFVGATAIAEGTAAVATDVNTASKVGATFATVTLDIAEGALAVVLGIVAVAAGVASKAITFLTVTIGWPVLAILALLAVGYLLTKWLFSTWNKKWQLKLDIAQINIDQSKKNLDILTEKFGRLDDRVQDARRKWDQALLIKVKLENQKNVFGDWKTQAFGAGWTGTLKMALAPLTLGIAPWLHYRAAAEASRKALDAFAKTYQNAIGIINNAKVSSAGLIRINEDIAKMNANIAKMTPVDARFQKAKIVDLQYQRDLYAQQLDQQQKLNAELAKGHNLYVDSTRELYIQIQAKKNLNVPLTKGTDYGIGAINLKTGARIGTEAQILAVDIAAATKALRDQMKSSANSVAEQSTQTVQTLSAVPQDIDAVLARDWAGMGAQIRKAVEDFASAWKDSAGKLMPKADIDVIAGRATAILGMATTLSSVLKVFSDLPTKFVTPLAQNWGALSGFVRTAFAGLNSAFSNTKDLSLISGRIDGITFILQSVMQFLANLSAMPQKFVAPLAQNWNALGEYVRTAFVGIEAAFHADTQLELLSNRMNAITIVLESIIKFVNTMGELPKKAVSIRNQAWDQLGEYVRNAFAGINLAFAKATDKDFGFIATRMASIMAVLQSIIKFVRLMQELPKKGISIANQDWKALGEYVRNAFVGIAGAFANTKDLESLPDKMAGITSVLVSVIKFLNTMQELPKKTLKLAKQDWNKLGEYVRDAFKGISGAFANTKDLESLPDKMAGITGVLVSVIKFLTTMQELPKKTLKLAKQDWNKLGEYVRDAFKGISAAFEKTEKLAAIPARIVAITTILQSVVGFLRMMQELPRKTLKLAKQDWTAMGKYVMDAFWGISKAFWGNENKALAAVPARIKQITAILASIVGFLKMLQELPKKTLKLTKQDYEKLANYVKDAFLNIIKAFYNLPALAAAAARLKVIADIAASITAFIKTLTELPKKAVKPGKQNWKFLADYVKVAMVGIADAFKAEKGLAASLAKLKVVSEIAGAINAFIKNIMDLPKKAIKPGKQDWKFLAEYVHDRSEDIRQAFGETQKLVKDAAKLTVVSAIAKSIGEFAKALADLPKKTIDPVKQDWKFLGRFVMDRIKDVSQAVILGPELTKNIAKLKVITQAAKMLLDFIKDIASLPVKTIKPVRQDWAGIANYVRDAVHDIAQTFHSLFQTFFGSESGWKIGNFNPVDDMKKDLERAKLITGAAQELGTLAKLFSALPTTPITPAAQDWSGLSTYVRDAVHDIAQTFHSLFQTFFGSEGGWKIGNFNPVDDMKKDMERAKLIIDGAKQLGDLADLFSALPTWVIKPAKQDWTGLANYVRDSVHEVAQTFHSLWQTFFGSEGGWKIGNLSPVDDMKKDMERAKLIVDGAKQLSDLVSLFSAMPTTRVQPAKQDWTMLANYVRDSVHDIAQTFHSLWQTLIGGEGWAKIGNLDPVEDMKKDMERAKLIADGAKQLGDLVNVFASMPTVGVKPSTQDWKKLGGMVAKAIDDIVQGFDDATTKTLEDAADKATKVVAVAKGLLDLITAFGSMPTEEVIPTKQNWTKLAQGVDEAIREITRVFNNDDELKKSTEKASGVLALAKNVVDFVTALSTLPTDTVVPAAQEWDKLVAYVQAASESMKKAFWNVDKLKEDAGRAGSVSSLTGSVASFINAIVSLPSTFVTTTEQDWTWLATYIKDAFDKMSAVFVQGDKLKDQADRAGSISGIAGSVGSFITALAGITEPINPAQQNWGALAVYINDAYQAIQGFFASKDQLEKDAARAGSISSIAGAVGGIISALSGITEQINPVQQNWGALAAYINNAYQAIQGFFAAKEQLEKDAARAGSISSIAGAVGGVISALAGITETINPAQQNWGVLAAYINNAYQAIQGFFAESKQLEKDAARAGSISSIAGAVGGVISALAGITETINPAAQDWSGLAEYINNAYQAIQGFFAESKQLEKDAARAGSISSIAGAVGGVISALAGITEKISPAQQNWGVLAAYINNAYQAIQGFFAESKQLEKDATRAGSISSVAGAVGGIISALEGITAKISPAKQNWGGLAAYINNAYQAIQGFFAANDQLEKDAARAGSIGSMAGGIGSFISALADYPKLKISVFTQNWGSLAKTLDYIFLQIIAVFHGSSAKQLEEMGAEMGSVGSMAGGIGTFIQALYDMPASAIKVFPQRWTRLAATVERVVGLVIAVFKRFNKDSLEIRASKMGSIAGMAQSLGTILQTLADMPDSKISVIPQKWKKLALAIKKAVNIVLNVFKGSSAGVLEAKAGKAGSVASIAGSLGSILQYFVDAPSYTAKAIPQAWGRLSTALAKGMNGVLKVFKAFSDGLLATKSARLASIAEIAGSLGNILKFFSEAPAKTMSATRQNWAALGSMLVNAMLNILASFKHFSTQALKMKSEKLGLVGTMVDVVNSVVDLASSLGDPAIMEKIRKFVNIDFGTIWLSIGNALVRMFTQISAGIKTIPDMTKMTDAAAALSSLSDIFANMVELSGNIQNRAGMPVTAVAGNPVVPAAYTPYTPPTASREATSPPDINITWQTYTGEPSAREKKALVGYLKPVIDAEVRRVLKTGFK